LPWLHWAFSLLALAGFCLKIDINKVFDCLSADFKAQSIFSLYVGVAVFSAPQDWVRGGLLFSVAMRLCVCFGVQCVFLSTRDTCFYVEIAAVWMWRHAEFVFFPTRNQRTAQCNRALTEHIQHLRIKRWTCP
jgi:hypothetical protein